MPTASGFQINPQELEQTARTFRSIGGATLHTMESFDREARALIGDDWLGLATREFAESYHQHARHLTSTTQTFLNIADSLEQIARGYLAADRSAAASTGVVTIDTSSTSVPFWTPTGSYIQMVPTDTLEALLANLAPNGESYSAGQAVRFFGAPENELVTMSAGAASGSILKNKENPFQ